MADPNFFPAWIRITHLINIVLMIFLLRSGLQIFCAFPRLYLHDNTQPGHEWLKLNRSEVPETDPDDVYKEIVAREAQEGSASGVDLQGPARNRIYTSLDEEADISPWLALPGHKQLGMGRHWHFLSDIFWVANGLVFVVLVFATGYWHFLVPQSWSIFPEAGHALLTYLHFNLAPNLPGQPFNALQKLSYFAIIFIVAPIQILAGFAMSPSLTARFPWYLKLFGGRQKARSIHFVVFVLFILFIIVHVTMVVFHGFAREAALIIFGRSERPTATIAISIAVLLAVVLLCALANWASLRHPHKVQRTFGVLLHRLLAATFDWEVSRQEYHRSDISPYLWVNGHPPVDQTYKDFVREGFAPWRLTVKGLVQQPLSLSLDDLRQLPKEVQITKHNCIQGWSDIAEWGGVSMGTILDLCHPTPQARYVVFHAMDNKTETELGREGKGYFYGTLNIRLARHPQTILAYEMNGEPLPVPHGAPLRLRCETELGFKMVKWVDSIELVANYQDIGAGLGGWREDFEHYDTEAGI